MVAGDVVTAMSASLTSQTFQPAVSVEVIILGLAIRNANVLTTNGTLDALLLVTTVVPGDGGSFQNVNVKIPINNTVYLKLAAADAGGGFDGTTYHGIQIK